MRKAYFYTRDKSNIEMWLEETPTTGTKTLDLHAYKDAINFAFEEWSEYKNKLPLVIEQDNGAIAVVFVVVKAGDVYIKRELQSGRREAIKVVNVASPVFYIAKPKEVASSENTITWQAGSKVNRIAIYNYGQESPHDIDTLVDLTGEKQGNLKFNLSERYGGTLCVFGKNIVSQAALTSIDETHFKTSTVSSILKNPTTTIKQPTLKITGEYEII